jgi:hypothetical protein
LSRWRYRIARRLLGYAPILIPDDDHPHIVIRHHDSFVIITPKTLSLRTENKLMPYEHGKTYVVSRRRGRISGTL